MRKGLLSIVAAIVFAGPAAPSAAADSPWNGTWKLDRAKSKLTGDTFSYTALAGGKMRFSNGATSVYTFACDGKAYPTIPGRTITCTTTGPAMYAFAYETGGKSTYRAKVTLSADGNTLTEAGTSIYADGKSSSEIDTSKRIGSGTGLAGTWKSTKTASSTPFVFTLVAAPGTITYTAEHSGVTAALKLDGTRSALTGPRVAPNIFLIAKPVGSSELTFTEIVAGKDAYDGIWMLSGDRKTLTFTNWAHGKKNEALVAVYEKQ